MATVFYRSILALALVAGCTTEPEVTVSASADALTSSVTRELVSGDIYHYTFTVRVGSTPNARLRIHRVVRERAPWQPRRTTGAAMVMHGDFASFASNFMPGLAPWLAARDIDVWGLDRRWASVAADGDVSDFDAMSLDQELDDVGTALAFARATRLVTDGSTDQLNLIGFSRGGELAYFYASREGARPAWQRHVKGIVPLDVYVSLAPADKDFRQFFCATAAAEYDALAAGFADGPNDFQIGLGRGDLDAPAAPNEFFPDLTNREAMLMFVGETYLLFTPSPVYHLAAPILDGDTVTGLRESSEPVIATWLASAPPHQSMREQADTDQMTCGGGPLALPLSNIHVPLFLLAAAGGYGDHALFSTTQVASTDVTTRVVRVLAPGREAEDFGHGDLLYSPAAPTLAWQPLLGWLRKH